MTALPKPELNKIKIGPVSDAATLQGFRCGATEIDSKVDDSYTLHSQHRARVFCATIPDIPKAYGFYVLSVSAHETKYLADDPMFADYLNKTFLPYIYLNQIGVTKEWQSHGIGTILLINALQRCEQVCRNVGIYGVALNALNDRVAGVYDKYGFRGLKKGGRSKMPFMVLPAQSLFDLFG